MAEKILITYYSRTGSTQVVANLIQEEIGGDIFEIQPEDPYPASYNDVVEQAKEEIQADYKPALKSTVDNIESYDTIIVGSPNWWSTIAPPVVTFLSEYDFSDKTIAPFCTHGGGGQGRINEDISKLCPHSNIVDCLQIYGGDARSAQPELSAWLRQINTTK